MAATISPVVPVPAGTYHVRPMPLWQALLYFGLPALFFRLCLYSGLPALINAGLPAFDAYVAAFTVPCAVLFALGLGLARQDVQALSWANLRARLRLAPMTGRDWLWAVATFVLTFLVTGLLGVTAQLLIGAWPWLAPPAFFPPWQQPGSSLTTSLFAGYVGAPLRGNWGAALAFFVMLFFNIFGEELWWRGYILPRQELVHARWTWAVNGGLWLAWHVVFYPWQIITLLPICLALPYVTQRRQNTWVGLIIHWQNGIVLLLVLAMVLGLA
jgi:membrane protease YdiL (CAAX protease family)